MTKNKTLNKVKPLLWENHLLLSFDSKWIDVFGSIPVFDVIIKNGRLVLLGPKLQGNKND
jgi:hypothetical protein